MISVTKIVADVEAKAKTVVSFLVKAYAAFYKNEPTVIKVVDDTVTYAVEGLDIVLGASGSTAAIPEVNAIVNEAVSDLNVAATLVYDFGPSPNAASIFAAVQANLATLETAGNVKDPVTLAKLKLIINAVGTVAQLVAKAVDAAKA